MGKPIGSPVTLVAVGDLHPCRGDPGGYFQQCRQILRQADIAFGQFEGVISANPSPDVYSPSCKNCCREAKIATALADSGFDILSLASNHAMDGGSQGLLDTIELFSRHGIQTVGAGATLEQALSPAILECRGTRVAFLASCSVMPIGYEADHDRPGVAPLHATSCYEQVDYQPGTPPLIRTFCNTDDLETLRAAVRAVRPRTDVVVVSFHFGVHLVPEYITNYEEEAAHAVIDEGADLVLGHHPHILKGIEAYKGKVIFYSLSDFALDVGCMKPPMHWFYNALIQAMIKGYPIKGYPWYFMNALDPEAEGCLTNPDRRKTIVAKADIRARRIERVSFLPAIFIPGRGPVVLTRQDARAQEVFDYVQRISRSQGLKATFAWDGDEVLITAD